MKYTIDLLNEYILVMQIRYGFSHFLLTFVFLIKSQHLNLLFDLISLDDGFWEKAQNAKLIETNYMFEKCETVCIS